MRLPYCRAGLGVEVRLEVHGRLTNDTSRIRRIIDHAGHPNALVCWNSDPGEVVDGSIRAAFDLLADRIALVHMRDLCARDYPWAELCKVPPGF